MILTGFNKNRGEDMKQRLLTLKRIPGKANENTFYDYIHSKESVDSSRLCYESIGDFVLDGFEKENETEEFSVLMKIEDTPGLFKNISEYYLFEYNIYDEKNNILVHWKDYARE